jgi:predicted metal-dependent peptidase
MFDLSVEEKLRKATKDVICDRYASVAAGTILLGDSSIEDDLPTACTDGRNKRYGRGFVQEHSVKEVAGTVLHEGGHIFFRHIQRHMDLIRKDARLANMAMDYANNDWIRSLPSYGTAFVLPEGHLYDEMFKGWSVRMIFDYLYKEKQDGGGGHRGVPLDEHDWKSFDNLSPADKQELDKRVTEAIQQSSLLAGLNNTSLPKQITELLQPEINWKDHLTDFFTNTMRGTDERSFKRFNRKRLMDDLYSPISINESVGDVIVAIDTSGSIGESELKEFASFLSTLCEQVEPSSVNVLWWDTKVHGRQEFTDSYSNIGEMLKPMGGGGTRASCVSQYIKENNLNADCIIMFTDGYLESNIDWSISIPTLWLVTRARNFVPPQGQVIKFNQQ